MHVFPIAEALFAVIVWGLSFIATKLALTLIVPVALVWLRFGIGVVILGVAVTLRRQLAWPTWKEHLRFAFLGFLGITFHQGLQATGLLTAAATTTSWIVSTIPIFIALLAWVFLGERMGPIRILGILLAAIGVLLVVSKGNWQEMAQGRIGSYGDFLVLLSAINWAVFSVLSRKELKKYPAAYLMFYVMAWGWLLTSIQFFFHSGIAEFDHLTLTGWSAGAFLGIFCSGLAYVAWYDALSVLPASRVGAFLYLEPLVTLIAATFALKEPMTMASIFGGLIILLGVYLVNRPAKD